MNAEWKGVLQYEGHTFLIMFILPNVYSLPKQTNSFKVNHTSGITLHRAIIVLPCTTLTETLY